VIQAKVREFIVNNMLYGEGGDLGEHDSLLGAGILDSTGVLELVTFLESTFGIRVEDGDIVPENLDSVGRIAAYVRRKPHPQSDVNTVAIRYAS
jgi:acyl carrier protein